jgi:hypothetical protein
VCKYSSGYSSFVQYYTPALLLDFIPKLVQLLEKLQNVKPFEFSGSVLVGESQSQQFCSGVIVAPQSMPQLCFCMEHMFVDISLK